MIERKRSLPTDLQEPIGAPSSARDFESRAHNFGEVDLVSNAEVVLDRRVDSDAGVYAQLDFVETLYINGKLGRIEFGVRRAYLTVLNEGPGTLSKVDELKGSTERRNVCYRTLQQAPEAISVCMNPATGSPSLGELALPPARHSNYLSKVAGATPDVASKHLNVDLLVSLNSEGLQLSDSSIGDISTQTTSKTKAIMNVAATKAASRNDCWVIQEGRLRESYQLERSRDYC